MYIFAARKSSSLKIIKVIPHNITLRDRAGVARWAHNPKVGCSNHSPATTKASVFTGAFYVYSLSCMYGMPFFNTFIQLRHNQ